MDTQWIVFSSILMINALASFAIAIMLTRQPARPGIHSMSYMLAGLCIWSFSYAMIAMTPTLEAKHFWLKVENVGIVSVPVLWFFFTMKFTRLDKWLSRKPTLFLFWIIPVITLILLFSEQWAHYYYTFTRVATDNGGPLIIGRGPWYRVQLVQSYALNLIGNAVLIWRFIKSRHVYRRQFLYLICATLIPLILNVIYQIVPQALPFFTVPVDLTPLSFTLTAILLAESIFGLRLFDLMPIARDTVMEHIPEMVFVVDSYDRVIDANSVAQKWIGKSFDEISGEDPVHVFRAWPQLLNRFFMTESTREEIEIPGNPPRFLELVITPIYNRLKAIEGRVIVAHDITSRKMLENDLKKANESLKIQLAEIESLRAKLQEQAIRDPLTGAFNRRFFAESLDKQTAHATRENIPFSIIIIDVDHFKDFNDRHGHKCGDLVLQALATFLKEHTRQGDTVCRYGGEEFVILMPDAPLEAAYQRAEYFRCKVADMEMECGGEKLKCTFSAGVASFPIHAASGDMLLSVADQALYQSKANGRNRVTVYKS